MTKTYRAASPPPSAMRADNIPLAVSTILFTIFALALGDAAIKRLSAELTLWQIFVLRSVLAAPILIGAIKLRYRLVSLAPREFTWTALRSLMLTFMWVAYYAALPHVELSVAAAAYYTLPLFITLFAALFIGDPIRPAGWAAVGVGFCGALLILEPRASDFNAYALLPIVSAILYALAMIVTRTKCRDEHPLVLSLALNVSFIGVGALASLVLFLWGPPSSRIESYPFLLDQWAAMGQNEWLAMSLLAAAILIGSVGAAIAYQTAPSSIVATFDFAYVAFAAGWGFVFFGEIPGAVTVTGMVLIVAAGLLALRR